MGIFRTELHSSPLQPGPTITTQLRPATSAKPRKKSTEDCLQFYQCEIFMTPLEGIFIVTYLT